MAGIPRQAFINKIRELGYAYKQQQARTHMYRRAGSTDVLFVRMKDALTEDYVKGALADAGLTDKQINEFLAIAKT